MSLAAKQKSHRPGKPLALGLRREPAGRIGNPAHSTCILAQIASRQEVDHVPCILAFLDFLRSQTRRARRRNSATASSQRRHSFRPILEALETRLTPSLTTLASFNGTYGEGSKAGLIMDSSGNLYGTTHGGGTSNEGTIFELAQGSSAITTLASFNGTNGAQPLAGLIMDSSGNLYGTTYEGGASPPSDGTVFELAKGSGTITTLASFKGTNGQDPEAGLIMDSSGNLYGTTYEGGPSNDGTVFELAKGSGTITTLASFKGTNGADPQAALIMDSSGNLYGTTEEGGPTWNPSLKVYGDGTVFELAKGSGTITTLFSFSPEQSWLGDSPRAGLIMDSSGNLYGTTAMGGSYNDGAVFELAPGSGTITTLASFNGSNGDLPYAGLIMDSSGNLYGTTAYGAKFGDGTVFEVAKGSGTITTLALFNGPTGSNPYAGLIMDNSGNLYGTTFYAGASDDGTVFELPGAAAETSIQVSGFPSATSAGAAQTFTVAVQADGATDTAYTGTVAFTSSDAQAVLPANYTFTAADAGVATFTATLKTAGTQSITATDTANGFLTGSGTTTVTATAASVLTIGGFPSPTTAGSAANVTVTALDTYGNIATGYTGTVHLTSSDAKAVLPANYTFTAADAGKHVFAVTLETAGTQSIAATDTVTAGLTSTQTGITVNPPQPPTVVHAAAANPSPVTGTTTSLSVQGADAAGASSLTYSWAVTSAPAGAPPPTFSSNGSNAAQNTTATFYRAGIYTFQVTITDPSGLTAVSSVTVTVVQTVTSISITPATVTVADGAKQQFTAVALDQFGQALTAQPTFTWQVSSSSGGTISSAGLYTAPKKGTGKFEVEVSADGLTALANVTVDA